MARTLIAIALGAALLLTGSAAPVAAGANLYTLRIFAIRQPAPGRAAVFGIETSTRYTWLEVEADGQVIAEHWYYEPGRGWLVHFEVMATGPALRVAAMTTSEHVTWPPRSIWLPLVATP